jgi:hypothetical protein
LTVEIHYLGLGLLIESFASNLPLIKFDSNSSNGFDFIDALIPWEPFKLNRIHPCSNSIQVQLNRIEFELFNSIRSATWDQIRLILFKETDMEDWVDLVVLKQFQVIGAVVDLL